MRLLREALPEIIAGLTVAAILSAIGVLYNRLGPLIVTFAVIGTIILALVLFILLSRRKQKLPQKGKSQSADEIISHSSQIDSSRKQTILFVDDDIEIFSSFIMCLEEEGFEVVVATNVIQAIDLLQSEKPLDLVVSDLIMPYGDEKQGKAKYLGLKVIEAARKYRGNIPVICLSVVQDKEVLHRLPELGVTEHLLKPIRLSELVQRVKLALLLAQRPPEQDLIADEIRRRKLELKSGYAYTRIRALWALGELGHYDPTILDFLKGIAKSDDDLDVRKAAKEAANKVRKSLMEHSAA